MLAPLCRFGFNFKNTDDDIKFNFRSEILLHVYVNYATQYTTQLETLFTTTFLNI